MRTPTFVSFLTAALLASAATGEPTLEWTSHRSADGVHPNGHEQALLWLMNRARGAPSEEGAWLATELHRDVSAGRGYFGVDTTALEDEFASLEPTPPAAFDRRLFEAAEAHSFALIARDSQDHDGQIAAVDASGFSHFGGRGTVFAYADSPLNAHAAFNIDWGAYPDGMQPSRAHRAALMGDYDSVGLAVVEDVDPTTGVGRFVTTGNYFYADPTAPGHFDRFVVGTVWEDLDGSGAYDPGEGLGGVTVTPDRGPYFATTAAGGGYAIPALTTGFYRVEFSGGPLHGTWSRWVEVGETNARLDLEPIPEPSAAWLQCVGSLLLAPLARRAARHRAGGRRG